MGALEFYKQEVSPAQAAVPKPPSLLRGGLASSERAKTPAPMPPVHCLLQQSLPGPVPRLSSALVLMGTPAPMWSGSGTVFRGSKRFDQEEAVPSATAKPVPGAQGTYTL